MRGHRDLELVVAATLACVLVALLSPLETVALIAAIPLCLFFPGYALAAAIFGRRTPDRPRLLLLTLMLSLAILVIGSLVLNYMPGGIRDVSWALLLVLVVLAAARWAALHRGSPRSGSLPRPRLPRLAALDAILLGIGASAAVAAIILSQVPLPAGNANGYTSLWMLPVPGEPDVMRVGVVSNEQDEESYRLLFRVDGREAAAARELTLEPGEEQVFRLPVGVPSGSNPARVAASLYHADSPRELYRRVTSWVTAADLTR